MLEIFGTIAGNILSLPGIVGLALGMCTRNIYVAVALGVMIGVIEIYIFGGGSLTSANPVEFGIAVVIGVIFASLGCLIRRKGATV